jgi:Predicted membrane protein
MESLSHLDWKTIFVPTLSIAEIFLRGTVIYLLLFMLLRVLRREAGAISVSDLLVVVLVADAAQNAMASDYKSITEGVLLVGTIVGWDYFLNWLGYRSRWVHNLLRPAPLPLIKDGRLLRRNLRQELITTDELMSELRQQGVESVDAVRRCYLEGDGHFSVITDQGEKSEHGKKKSLTS